MRKILYTILFCTSALSFDYYDQGWLNLLRYKKTLLGNYESEVDAQTFFTDLDGKNSPQKELDTFIFKLKNNQMSDSHVACLFPARATYLARKYSLKLPFNPALCPKFVELRQKINIKNVSLVFSSYFIEKPASAFGHTFLKIATNDSKDEENDYLDYAVDFSAQVTTKNPILYGIMGIFGGFKGKFSLMPYYVKIKEYNDMESRDLWDFKLNLNSEELEFFIMHLYEMNLAYFDYYYFRENCSYHVLGLINAIKPEWNLMDKLKYFVPPIDTIHALNSSSKIVTQTSFRASKYQSLNTKILNLDSTLQEVYAQTVSLEAVPEQKYKNLSKNEKAELLEFLSDYIDFRYASELGQKESEIYKKILAKKFKINMLRSQINAQSKTADYSNIIKYNSPLDGHNSKRMKFSLGRNNELTTNTAEFEYRFALHDYLDHKLGYIPFSTSELGNMKFIYLKNLHKFKLSEFKIVNVEALRPKTLFSNSMSWTFSAGVKDDNLQSKNDYYSYMNFSLGKAHQMNNFSFAYFLATKNNASLSHKAFNNYLGPEILLVHNNNLINFSLKANYLYDTFDSHEFEYNISFESRLALSLNSSIGFELKQKEDTKTIYSLGFLKNF